MTAASRRRVRALHALSERAPALAAACAVTACAAFSLALAVAFFARPTRAYVFPLLADIDERHPESGILRSGAALATLLLAATAAGAVGAVAPAQPQHAAAAAASAAAVDERAVTPDVDAWAKLRARKLAIVSLALAAASALLVIQSRGAAKIVDGDALAAIESVRGAAGAAMVSVVAASWLVMLLFLIWFFLRLQATAVDYTVPPVGDGFATASDANRDYPSDGDSDGVGIQLSSPFPAVAPSTSGVSENVFTMSSATGWDATGGASALIQRRTGESAPTPAPGGFMGVISSIPVVLSSSVSSIQSMREMEGPELRAYLAPRLRAFGWRMVAIFRPVCLTAQVVSVIKISGLIFALNTFSISKIRLIRTALLAALAFAQYTAIFFVAFFLLILAVDMRRAAEDERWRLRLKLASSSPSQRSNGSV